MVYWAATPLFLNNQKCLVYITAWPDPLSSAKSHLTGYDSHSLMFPPVDLIWNCYYKQNSDDNHAEDV